MNFKALCFVDMPFGPKPPLKKDYKLPCRSLRRLFLQQHILAGVSPMKRSVKTVIPKLIF